MWVKIKIGKIIWLKWLEKYPIYSKFSLRPREPQGNQLTIKGKKKLCN
jgi:hypothetical protein